MKKYSKPISQDLGLLLPSAESNCKSGGQANPGSGGASSCKAGSVASMAACIGDGGAAAGCDTGSVPFSTCTDGTGVQG